jgi:hypothetical protein
VEDCSDIEKVQKKILLFFGRLSSDLHSFILPSDEEMGDLSTAWDPERKLDFAIPFPGKGAGRGSAGIKVS